MLEHEETSLHKSFDNRGHDDDRIHTSHLTSNSDVCRLVVGIGQIKKKSSVSVNDSFLNGKCN